MNLRGAACRLGGFPFSRNKETYQIKGLKIGPQLNRHWPILLQPADRAHAYLYPKDVQNLKGKEIRDIYVITGDGKRRALSKAERQCFADALANAAQSDPGVVTLRRDLEMVCNNIKMPGVSTGPVGVFFHTFPAGTTVDVTIENQTAAAVVDGMLWTCPAEQLAKAISD